MCYLCSDKGHIQLNCPKRKTNVQGPKLRWVPKGRCYFAGTMKAKVHDSTWYLDSGCSRHMTGEKDRFPLLSIHNGGTVTFGDNSKGEIVNKGESVDRLLSMAER